MSGGHCLCFTPVLVLELSVCSSPGVGWNPACSLPCLDFETSPAPSAVSVPWVAMPVGLLCLPNQNLTFYEFCEGFYHT